MNNKRQEFSFGTMGEVIENIRTFVTPIDDYTYTFAMSFDYDTWNRIKSMRYPDGELVEYGAETTYQYDLLNRLSTLTSISNNGTMQNINYTYDLVNNIDSVSNTAMPLNNGLGAQYFQKHNYDNLYRLTGSNGNWHVGNGFNGSYNLSLTYTDDGKIITKTQYAEQLFTNTLGALSYDYAYNYSQNQIHTLQTVEDLNSSTIYNFQYDANGNLIYQTNPDYSERYLCWDEENRLMAVSDKRYSSYYMYDNGGERAYKLTGMNETMNINGNWFNIARLREETLYSSAYLVATHQGYTKHYYAGSERIASCIGQGGLSIIDQPLTLVSNENWITKKNILHHQMGTVFGDCLNKMFDEKENGLYNLYGLTEAHTAIMEQYFYHPDHLGSTSWITDGSGNAIQYMHYLPYGEEWIDQQSTSWNAPYTFTGKIKDAETGYNYFGARYYDSKLSVWLSVDPLSDKYPSMSPYTYCANNPIMMVDPDGRKVLNYYTKVVEFYQDRVNSLNKLIDNYSGDKNSEEYMNLVKNRDDHVRDMNSAQYMETEVNLILDAFNTKFPTYFDLVDDLRDKHGKSVDLVIKFNSNLDALGRTRFQSNGETFSGSFSDDLYSDMMDGRAPIFKSEQLIQIKWYGDVASLAHEFGHAFFQVAFIDKYWPFFISSSVYPEEELDEHQHGDPSGVEAKHWEDVYNGKAIKKY